MSQAYTDTNGSVTSADPTVLSQRQVTGWQTTSSSATSHRSSSSTSSTASPKPSQDKGGTSVGAIVGGAVGGGIVLIALVVGLVIYFVKHNNKKKTKGSQQAYTQVPPGGPDNWMNPDPRMSQYTTQQPMQNYSEFPSPPVGNGYYGTDHKDVMTTSTNSIPSPPSQDYKFPQPGQDMPLQSMGHNGMPQQYQQPLQMPGHTMMAPPQQQHAPISELPSTNFSPTGPHAPNGPVYEMGTGG